MKRSLLAMFRRGEVLDMVVVRPLGIDVTSRTSAGALIGIVSYVDALRVLAR